MERLSQSRLSEKSRVVTLKEKGEKVDWKRPVIIMYSKLIRSSTLELNRTRDSVVCSTAVLCVVRQHSSPGALCDETKNGWK